MNQDCSDIILMMCQSYSKDLSVYDESFLLKSINKRLVANSLSHLSEYLHLLSKSREEADLLLGSLTINYSLFFRNPFTFALLEQTILPLLLKSKVSKDEIRIWSAGCAAGQEAYSIAMLFDQIISNEGIAPSIRIFATDINPTNIEMARKGVFDANSVQNLSYKYMEQYFVRDGDHFNLISRIKDRIEFSVYDLLDNQSISPPASIYGDFDLVICSNLLFYYTHDARRTILNKLYRSLTPEGYFITGEVERGIVKKLDGFHEVAAPTAVYQKMTNDR